MPLTWGVGGGKGGGGGFCLLGWIILTGRLPYKTPQRSLRPSSEAQPSPVDVPAPGFQARSSLYLSILL